MGVLRNTARPTAESRALLLSLLVSIVLWNLPFGGLVLYPFKLFATWLHELSHGVVMMITGAGFDYMDIYPDTSGLAFARYGVSNPGEAAIASAGYIGTATAGAILLVVGRTPRMARWALAVVATALLATALVWIRNDFGKLFALIGACAFGAAAVAVRAGLVRFLLGFVAAQSCINALLDLRVVLRANLVVDGQVVGRSDAHTMATTVGFGDYWMWAALWLAWSLVLLYLALRSLRLREQRAYRTVAAADAADAADDTDPDDPTSARWSQGSASM